MKKPFKELTTELKLMVVTLLMFIPVGLIGVMLGLVALTVNLAYTVIVYHIAISDRDKADAIRTGKLLATSIVSTVIEKPISFIESKFMG